MKTFGIIYAAHLLVNYATVVHSRAASTTCVDSTNSELYLHDGVPLVTDPKSGTNYNHIWKKYGLNVEKEMPKLNTAVESGKKVFKTLQHYDTKVPRTSATFPMLKKYYSKAGKVNQRTSKGTDLFKNDEEMKLLNFFDKAPLKIVGLKKPTDEHILDSSSTRIVWANKDGIDARDAPVSDAIYMPDAKTIIAMNSVAKNDMHYDSTTFDRIPISEIMWLSWVDTAQQLDSQASNLKFIIQHSVSGKSGATVIELINKMGIAEPGHFIDRPIELTGNIDDDLVLYALLGCDNCKSMIYTLIDHREQLGGRLVERIVVDVNESMCLLVLSDTPPRTPPTSS